MGFYRGDQEILSDDDFIHATCSECGWGFAFMLDEYDPDCVCDEVLCQRCDAEHACEEEVRHV